MKQQVEAGSYGNTYQRGLHTYIHQFFDFIIDERFDTSPNRNPFSVRDLPRKPDMLPRYPSDQELRTILNYCEQGATQFEQTLVITGYSRGGICPPESLPSSPGGRSVEIA